jgi:hypothetical protein
MMIRLSGSARIWRLGWFRLLASGRPIRPTDLRDRANVSVQTHSHIRMYIDIMKEYYACRHQYNGYLAVLDGTTQR